MSLMEMIEMRVLRIGFLFDSLSAHPLSCTYLVLPTISPEITSALKHTKTNLPIQQVPGLRHSKC